MRRNWLMDRHVHHLWVDRDQHAGRSRQGSESEVAELRGQSMTTTS